MERWVFPCPEKESMDKMKVAMFVYKDGLYYPANKNAVAECAKLSRMKLRDSDMVVVISNGYRAFLTNGQEIGKVNILA